MTLSKELEMREERNVRVKCEPILVGGEREFISKSSFSSLRAEVGLTLSMDPNYMPVTCNALTKGMQVER